MWRVLALAALAVGCSSTALSPAGVGGARACVTRPLWRDVPQGADDPILGLNQAFVADASPDKVSLVVGAYRDAHGKPVVLRAVRAAEERIVAAALPKEYTPIAGMAEFVRAAIALMLGDNSSALTEGRIAAVQTLSGTGACRVAADLLARFPSPDAEPAAAKLIYVPEPTWSNHWAIFHDAGLTVRGYRYWDGDSLGLDEDGLLEDLRAAPRGATLLLHACAHNPTGVDPTSAQWARIADVVEERALRVLFDSAYQGFASGDPERDAAAVRLFVERGHPIMLAQSFAKNFGLYGERVGALSVVTASVAEASTVLSQLKLVIRPMYSSPPLHGARIVAQVLGDPALKQLWLEDCAGMAARIAQMRSALRTELESLQPGRSWAHMSSQIGMFCFSGLRPEEVDALREQYHLYLTRDGRISMASVNPGNVRHVAQAITEVMATRADEGV
ncbi:hypothetical protein KFE25_010072 [Diacronema lutheri]|uniref:Aspartate aminotransferase n=1 Tax=Diacronema lutheri TaxID=2081491 RepID=A0A8J5XQ69_DIALT|nr:hypothetical protein KFE25_010072 [Diacronema lutheri]